MNLVNYELNFKWWNVTSMLPTFLPYLRYLGTQGKNGVYWKLFSSILFSLLSWLSFHGRSPTLLINSSSKGLVSLKFLHCLSTGSVGGLHWILFKEPKHGLCICFFVSGWKMMLEQVDSSFAALDNVVSQTKRIAASVNHIAIIWF